LIRFLGKSVTWGLGREGRVLSSGGDGARNEDDRRGILADVIVVLESRVWEENVCWVDGGTAGTSESLCDAGLRKGVGVDLGRLSGRGDSGAFEMSVGWVVAKGFRVVSLVGKLCQINGLEFEEVEGIEV
jgi:hypothetical protein